jgi:acyl-CoA synthetase (AMP-forming)/AMP-acid ligase II
VPPEYIGAFGTTVPGVEVKIVNPENGELMPDGMDGEIVVRGYSLMLGIYKQERVDTFDDAGWYHTGDFGHFRDGWFFFTGRHSDMIKTGGSNVAPAEVELCLLSFPEIMRAFVLGVDHPSRGQDAVALIVPWSVEGEVPIVDAGDVKRRLKELLSAFKVPRYIFVIDEEDVAWLPSLKPDRRALGALAEKLTGSSS